MAWDYNTLLICCAMLYDHMTMKCLIFSSDMDCRINQQNEAAKKGLERLEKQMKVRRPVYTALMSDWAFGLHCLV